MLIPHDFSYARQRHQETILRMPNVVGVGVGNKEVRGQRTRQMTVTALVRKKVPEAGLRPEDVIPKEVGGLPTDVIEVGDLRALQSRTARLRPAPGGVSVGHYQVTAGTLGCLVRDRTTGRRLILSNNHVLANSNDARVGDAILQPGAIDGGRDPADTIAELERFVAVQFLQGPATCGVALGAVALGNALAGVLGSKHRLMAYRYDSQAVNQMDAAVARPLEEAAVSNEILDIGELGGTAPAGLGMRVRKSGRSSGLTSGEITVLEATVTVGYGEKTARFEGQIISGPMSEPGDSGSVLVAADSLLAVGLLFAGSQQATIYNPIQAVLTALDVAL